MIANVVNSKYSIVYNLTETEGLNLILPSALICNSDKTGLPAYIQAVALPDTLESYGLNYKNTVHQELIEICRSLSLPNLELELNRNKKKPVSLSVLFSDPVVKKSLQSLIDRKLNAFFEKVKMHNLVLCFDLKRKIKATDCQLNFYSETATPLIKFIKTQTGIRYILKLSIGEEVLIPCKSSIRIITNFPAMLIIGRQMVTLENLNAAKLRPFLINESVFVPSKLTKQYFEQFVADLLGKMDIEVEGFDIIKHSEIKSKTLQFVFNIFKGIWQLELIIHYDKYAFSTTNPGKRKIFIDFENENSIVVYQCIRNFEEENKCIDALLSAGLTLDEYGRFVYGAGKFDTIHFCISRIDLLRKDYDIVLPRHEGKEIQLESIQVSSGFYLENDWFDLHGVVEIGDHQFPLANLFSNIKKNDPFFKLPDGTLVIIPDSFFSEYEGIVKFAVEQDRGWKLSKKYFNLLNNAQQMTIPIKNGVNQEDNVDYLHSKRLKATLRPYQIQGVKWLINHRINNMGACLADDMGLGKTLQTIAALVDAKDNLSTDDAQTFAGIQLDLFGDQIAVKSKPLCALIVLPASLVYNWYSEFKKYAPSLHVLNYYGSNRSKASKTMHTFDIVITTYQTAVSDIEMLRKMEFSYIVLDESQQIRNRNSKVFSTLNLLHAPFKITLSGTPIENSLSDLWSQMEFINPDILGSFSFFKQNYLMPIEKAQDESALKELKMLIDPFILRRTKEQVAKDLPPLMENTHFSTMSEKQTELFEKEKSAARNYLMSLQLGHTQSRIHILSSLLKMRQISNHPVLANPDFQGESGKFEDVKNKIVEIIKSGHKVLVFSSFLTHLDLVGQWLDSLQCQYVKLTGAMKGEDKNKSVVSFQSDKTIQVFLLSIKAGGTGLNLTAADYVFILDPWWNPFVEKQAIARAHRIGRMNNVVVTRFISKDSIEEKIIKLQEKKKSLAENIIDIDDMMHLDDDDLMELLH